MDQALQVLADATSNKDPYQVVIADVLLEKKRGIDLAKTIKQDPALKNTNIILTIPYDDPALIDDALASGFSLILTKPIRQSNLLDCLVRL